MAKIFVDGVEYEVKDGENVLEACLGAGLDLPYFCWHPEMGSIGSCRQCALVQYQNEEDERGRIVMGCMTPVMDGARFSLKAENGQKFRESVIEAMMTNHPHDCPVCAEGGECHLQDMTVMVGHRDRRYKGRKNTHVNQYLGPLIHHEMNRCITCYRCVRYYRDYAGGTDLAAQASHDHTYFGRQCDGVLESEFSGNLVEVCPTGVFTDKTLLKDYSRKWDLQSAPSICNGCALGCNTSAGERYGRLKRIHNRYHHEVNGYFLCDRGRFGSGYVNGDRRLDQIGERLADGTFAAIDSERAMALLRDWLVGKKVAAVGSPRASVEANWQLKQLVGSENFYAGVESGEARVNQAIYAAMQCGAVPIASLRDMESADAVLILGEDVTQTAPRAALAIRQALRNKAKQLGEDARFMDWQDAAIRNLAQDQCSPLMIFSPHQTRLDEVASTAVLAAPAGIELLAEQILEGLRTGASGDSRVTAIVAALTSAKRPLIVAGSGLQSEYLVNTARAIAEQLAGDERQPMLSYTLAEANSLGLAMLGGRPLDTLAQAGELDALIVLENDLSRRMTPAELEQLCQQSKKIIGLDLIDQPFLDHCDLVLPVASFVESEGTLVSSEGRAQRYFPAFAPLQQRQANWQWLTGLAHLLENKQLSGIDHFDQITRACAAAEPALAKIAEAAPDHQFRSRGQKIPRQTHRYSGRTAMRADVSVHEPQQPADAETALAYSMEGSSGAKPSALQPFIWSPGWNSNQAVQKFQSEVGGALRGGSAGVRLIEPAGDTAPEVSAAGDGSEALQLVPVHRIHGSEELSALTAEIAELAGDAFVLLSRHHAHALGVNSGDGVVLEGAHGAVSLQVTIAVVAENCIGYSAGFRDTLHLRVGQAVSVRRDENWVRKTPQMIASDRGGQHG